MRKLHPSPYTSSDIQRLIDFRRACTTPENSNDYPTVVDLQESLSSPSSNNMLASLWVDEHNNIIAYGIVALSYCNLYFLIHPEAQTDELATDIINWGIQQLQEHTACSTLDTPCRDTDVERVALLERHNFECSDIQTLHMSRSLADDITAPTFPEGFILRPIQGEDEIEAVVALHRAAFGTEYMTVEHRMDIMHGPTYIQELDLLLVAPDGTLAAFCYCTIPQEGSRQQGHREGEIATIGTHPAYQHRGIGRAMILAGMLQLKEHGVEVAVLGVSSENIQAQSVYYAAGFEIQYRSLWYTKKV